MSETDVKFDAPNAGEWVVPVMRNYLLQCCDCGLVHRMDFRVIRINKKLSKGMRKATIQGAGYQVQFRAYRAET